MKLFSEKVHLGISAGIVIGVSFVYGFNPAKILPLVFDFTVENLELKNIFRAIMGLYIGFGVFWIIGLLKPYYREAALISNIIFMGGLAFGRGISTLFDGISAQYTMGMLLEFLFMIWGIYNLKKMKNS